MVRTVTLANGLTIVLEEIPFIRSISFGIWVRNGSRNESAGTNGISHFIEHMLFKGTDNRSAMDIADEMDAVGGQLNAYTAKEFTCYYTRTLDTHFDTALDILSDMLLHSKFDEAEISKERNVITEELNMYEDSPDELVHDLLELSIFDGNPLGFSILGTEKSISSFNTDTFYQYYNENYHPQNTVIAAAGNFKAEEAIAKIEKYFGCMSREAEYKANDIPAVYRPRFVAKEKDIEQVHVSIGFPSIKMGTEESYALSMINTIFGGGMSSRLFQKVREEHGLAYSIYSNNASYVDTGLFSIYAALNPSSLEQVILLIMDEIRRLDTDKITSEQLVKTKEQLKSNYLMSLESSSSRMSSIGRSRLLLNRILSPDELIEKIDSVTLDKIYDLIGEIFDFKQMSISAVGKLKGMSLEKIAGGGFNGRPV